MKTLPAPYKFKKRRKHPRPEVTNRVQVVTEEENLTGEVMGKKASDIEERFARALYKNQNVQNFSFREHFFGPARNTPGAVEIDYIVFDGAWWPIQIDGQYAHKSQGQRGEDKIKDALLNQYFSSVGINAVRRIPDGKEYMPGILDEQSNVDEVVKELFG